jgi:hypothetical protein
MDNILEQIEDLAQINNNRIPYYFDIKLINQNLVFEFLSKTHKINELKTLKSKIDYFHQSLYSSRLADDTAFKIAFIFSKYLEINYSIFDIISLVNICNLIKENTFRLNQESFMLSSKVANKLAEDINSSIIMDKSDSISRIHCDLETNDYLKYKYSFFKKIFGIDATKKIIDSKIKDSYLWMIGKPEQYSQDNIDSNKEITYKRHYKAFKWDGDISSCFEKNKRTGWIYDSGTNGEYEHNFYDYRNDWLSYLNIKIENSLSAQTHSKTDAENFRFTEKLLITYESVTISGLNKIYKNVLILDELSLRVIDSILEFKTKEKIEILIKKEINKSSYEIKQIIEKSGNEFIFEIEDSKKIKHARSIIEKMEIDRRFSFKRLMLKYSFNKNKLKIIVTGVERNRFIRDKTCETEDSEIYAKEISKYLGKLKFVSVSQGGMSTELHQFDVTLRSDKEMEFIDNLYVPLTSLKVKCVYKANRDIKIGKSTVKKGSKFKVTHVGYDYCNTTKMTLLSGALNINSVGKGFNSVEKLTANNSLDELNLEYDPYHGDIPDCELLINIK